MLELMPGYENNKLLLPPRAAGESLQREVLNYCQEFCSELIDDGKLRIPRKHIPVLTYLYLRVISMCVCVKLCPATLFPAQSIPASGELISPSQDSLTEEKTRKKETRKVRKTSYIQLHQLYPYIICLPSGHNPGHSPIISRLGVQDKLYNIHRLYSIF